VICVQETAFNPGEETNAFLSNNANAGAVATFIGQVRDFTLLDSSDHKKITKLDLEHYSGMTEKELARISDEAKARWPLDDVLIIHRFGPMRPGEPIVLVCVASTHRDDAFAACEFLMDWLKTQAPFWKREETDSGFAWVEACQSDDERAARWNKAQN